MPNLHVHYYHGNLKQFRQELDGSGAAYGKGWTGSGSAGKSWTGNGMTPIKADPNERDSYGRTVLHLAAGNNTPQAYAFLTILLRNPNIAVNLFDYESGYTALHRALFVGNIRAARDLLARNDVDPSIKDMEGLTAFDLYNGTVDGTNPTQGAVGTDLYVWGVNRNFALGTGDSSDKAYPDRINLLTQNQASGKPDLTKRFDHVGVHDITMSKLHTGVVTTETRGNLSVCGFGSNGRLGRSIHSQLALLPMGDLPHTITSIALGQDHTLALTSGGYILSWGQNRFSQLGYVIDAPENPMAKFGKEEDAVQVSPRRIVGPLKKEWIRGVAAGRMSSACWTADSVWTWGTNAGHLGYEKASNPVQILPRKVTAISSTVIDIALSDYAMICLLDTFDVICFHHDTNFKISFPTPRIFSDAFPFRPPQSTIKPMIQKVTSCGQTFAALSSIGDVFTFQLPNPAEDVSKDIRDRHVTVKPQLIWALRKSFTAVKDVALGSDGTVIICTHSGHVFVRSRSKAGAGLKFKRIPYLQRVIKVACNESGAFAAIRVDAKAKAIQLTGRTLEEDMALLQPHFRRFEHQMTAEDFDREASGTKAEDDEEDEGSNSIAKDLAIANRLCTILRRWRADDTDSLFSWSEPSLGSDVHLVVGDLAIPAHSTVLALRSTVLRDVLKGKRVDKITSTTSAAGHRLKLQACHPMALLLLLQYIYSDEVASIWDARVSRALQIKYPDLALPIAQIKADLKSLADVLGLAPLSQVLESAGKVDMPKRTLPANLATFFDSTWTNPNAACDMTLVLADKEVHCSSTIMRARCPFFEAMFADHDWTVARQDEGNVVVNMEHLRWRPMRMVFRYIHEGREDDLFDYLHQETLDEFLDFVFEVLAAATELLLDRLILVCSRVIIDHCNAYNAAALACEAAFYQAETLKLSVFDYIISSMETMLESGLLDDMHEDVLLELCTVIARKQENKLSISRSGVLVAMAMEKQKEWLSLQDIPAPRIRQPWRWKPRSPALSPVDTMTTTRIRQISSPLMSPEIRPSTGGDDMFTMDDITPPLGAVTPRSSRPMTPLDLAAGPSRGPVWKSKAVEAEKVDLRSVMAEAAASKTTPSRPAATPSHTPSGARIPGSLAGTPTKSPALARSPPSVGPGSSSTPWRAIEGRQASFPSLQAQHAPTPSGSRPSGSSSPIPNRTPSASKVITPIKLQPAPSGVQRKSSGAAWATSTSFAPPPVAASVSPDSRSFSLLAIQQEERDFADKSKRPVATKSFAEIQAEEREAEANRVKEEEFLRWWEEEQARVGKGGTSEEKGRGGGGARGRGRGRGGASDKEPAQRKVPPKSDRGKAKGPGPSKSAANGDGVDGERKPPTGPAGQQGKGRSKDARPAAINGHAPKAPRSEPRHNGNQPVQQAPKPALSAAAAPFVFGGAT